MDSVFSRRPLALFSLSLLLSSTLFLLINAKTGTCLILVPFFLFVLIAATLAFAAGKLRKEYFSFLFTATLAVVLSLLSLCVHFIPTEKSISRLEGTHTVSGYVSQIVYNTDYGAAAVVSLGECDEKEINAKVYLKTTSRIPDEKYRNFTFTGYFASSADRPDDFYSFRSLAAKSVFTVCECDTESISYNDKAGGILPFFGRINKWICSLVSYKFGDESSALINSLLFGNTELLSGETSRDFKTLGITHLLVVSGMNIAVIADFFDRILRRLHLSRAARSVICSFICFFYSGLCGFGYSVIRASLMQIVYRLCILFRREGDSLTSLFFSLGIIVLLNPYAVFDIGLMLSFFATLGIVSYSQGQILFIGGTSDEFITVRKSDKKPIKLLKHFANDSISSLIVSMAASVFTLPISFFVFGEMSLLGPAATLLFSGFLDFLLFAIPFALPAAYIPFIGKIAVFFLDIICKAVNHLIGFAYLFKDTHISLSGDFETLLVCVLIAAAVVSLFIKPKKQYVRVLPSVIVWFIISATGIISSLGSGMFYIRQTDGETYYTNEAFAIRYGGKSTIIDISSGSGGFSSDVRRNASLSLGGTNTDCLVLTHLHPNHISLIHRLCTNGYLERVYLPEELSAPEAKGSVVSSIRTLSDIFGFEIIAYESGSVLPGDGFFGESISVIPSDGDKPSVLIDRKDGCVLYLSNNAEKSAAPFLEKLENGSAVIFGAHGGSADNTVSGILFPDDCIFFSSHPTGKMKIYGIDVSEMIPTENGIPLFFDT